MSGIPKLQYHPNYISPFCPGKAGFWLVLTFLMVFAGWSVVGQTNPTYSWEKAVFMGTAGVSSLDKLVISVDVDSKGNIYALTFGKKILKYNANGGSPSSYTLQANIEGPVDMAINSQDEMYVADYEGRTIFAFDLNGNNLVSKNKSSSYFKPLGIAFDKNDNLYVADYNDGSGAESTPGSRLKIHYSIGGQSSDLLTNKLIQPYRLDLDSKNNIYISHVGSSGKGEVKVFNENFQEVPILTGITSPGSIVVDNEDFIHVIDYAGKVNFQAFIKRDLSAIFNMLPGIRTGVKDNLFNIQVYDSNGTSIGVVSESSPRQIDFPLDMAFNYCFSKLYLNDAYIGTGPFDFKLDFNLEIFKRAPDFDTEKPLITCRADILKDADPGKNYAVVSYANPAFSDNCSTPTLTQTGLVSGSQFPIGINDITFTATDSAGNTATCSFSITVKPGEEVNMPPVFVNCPVNMIENNDLGFCGAVVTFQTPVATDDNNNVTVTRIGTGLQSGDLFPLGTNTLNFEANDGVNTPVSCSFTVTVLDNENPTITCPSNKTENVANGKTNKVVTYTSPVFNDNCSGSSIVQTAGLVSGSNFPLGTTTNTFVVTDASGNTADCSFTIKITEDSDTEIPVITCPATITKNVDSEICGAIANYTTPTATDNSGTPTIRFKSGLESGSVFPVGITTVIYEAEDAAGNKAECSFTITVLDNKNPTITCPSNRTETVGIGQTNKVVIYNLPVFNDNCSGSSIVQTAGLVSGSNFPLGTTTNTFVVTDASGNTADCSFTIKITEDSDTEIPVITCPATITKNVDSEICGAIANYITPTATDNSGTPTVQLKSGLASGSVFPVGITTVIYEAEDAVGNKVECGFSITVIDNEEPKITCPSDKTENYDPAIGFNLPDYTGLGITNDNCGLVNVTQFPAIGTLVTGNTQIILTATDAADNSSTCTFMVNLSENEVLDLDCPIDQIGQLNENCQFTIPDYNGLASVNFQNAIITQYPSVGTIVSEVTIIRLISTFNGQTDECSFQLILEDVIAPVANCAMGYDIWLNANGTGFLNAAEIDKQSSDNCGIESMEIDKTTFTSVDIGVIKVTLTVIDVAGNSDSCETSVTVHPYDPEEPSEEIFEYIFIYPNPTPGPVIFDTPSGWSIEKVEVYDARGRYILTETYLKTQIEYSMDLSSLQQAVYILKLYTSRGIRIIRVIIY